ncbi:hypothetical protein FB645_002056 [Coemansia sp. IMI 203386]|nr:hypothetical protein FB645_002056 [Coemansia sp. IMI 203386]
MESVFVQRYCAVAQRPKRNRNVNDLSVDIQFVVAHTNFDSHHEGILTIRPGDIVRVTHGGNSHPKWWQGTIIRSYFGNKGTGYFFPVLTQSYTFMDNRIASRIPMALLDVHGQLARFRKKRAN